ncbi:MAG: hypothetical protein LBP58_06970 [Azoarcus sp.]|jgi:hypothetical protein|nr:hypothetical protein [Azoarcus sp.]
MQTIPIKLRRGGGPCCALLTLTGNPKCPIATQYDNESAVLVFERDPYYAEHALTLYFASAAGLLEPVRIGLDDEFPLPAALTQTTSLTLQVRAYKDGIEERSNMVYFILRGSLDGSATPVPPWPPGPDDIVQTVQVALDEGEILVPWGAMKGSIDNQPDLSNRLNTVDGGVF